MQKWNFRGALRNLFVMSSAALVLTGCLMDDEEAATDAETVTDNEISGSVGDGPVVGTAMRVVASNGALLAEFESDASANYNVTVRTKGKDYPLLVDARNGVDIVTTLAPDFVLLSAVREPGKKTVANVNPFSTLAVEAARDLPEGLSKQGLAIAEDRVVATLGVGLATLAASGPVSTPVDAGNIAELVRASEEVGEIIRRVRDLQLAFGRPATGDSVLQAIASDSIDGVIDGRGGSRANARVAALTSIVAVQVLLESMQNELHVNGGNASAALASAIARVGGAGVDPALEDLVVTPATLAMVDVGLDAILAVVDDPDVAGIAEAVAGLQGGMDAVFIGSLVPGNYRVTLENALMTIAGSGDATMDTINDVVRSGGTEPPPVNEPPTISGTPGTNVEEGSSYAFTPAANDPNGDVLTFSIGGQPGWANFDTATGALTGTPASGDAGTYAGIVISVTDGEFTASLPAFTITVTAPEPPPPANEPPTISGSPATSVEEGQAYSFTPTASDPNDDVLTFSIAGQPGWADFDTANGTLSGTPASGDAGTYLGIVISVTDGEFTASLPAFTITVTAPEPPPPANEPPTISGTPGTEVNANSAYSFTPSASDPEGDTLTFSISGQPGWATFNAATGTLSGTPGDADVGVYENIVISVSDGEFTASLPAFSITVNAISLGSVTLTWTPPTENDDGTPLTDLAGYKLYWGTTPGVYTDSVTLDNPGLTSYVVEGLAPGTYEFVATSYNASGVESVYSNPATKTVP